MTGRFSPDKIPQLKEPAPIVWEREHFWHLLKISGYEVATMEPRPDYCDRGRWIVKCELPGIDGSDGFPRYYMSYDSAVAEMDAWLRWRLWKIRPGGR